MAYVDTIGRYGEGNIDLNNRKVIYNQDGTISTEKSFSVGIGNKEVLLPTIVNGVELSQNDAITHYNQTGEYLGKFNTVEDANDYAQRLHERQLWYYTIGRFNGKLLEVKIDTYYAEFPLKYIKADTYKATPNQRMETEAARAASGKLVRSTVEHTATKIEFTTTDLTNRDINMINIMLSNAYINVKERKLKARYYDPETDTYKTGEFYVPDVDLDISRIDKAESLIYYKPVRYAFIEY